MTEATYDVVWPSGRTTGPKVGTQQGLSDLSGKKIALVWDHLFKGDEILAALQKRVSIGHDDVEFIDHDNFIGTFADDYGVFPQLSEQLRASGADAAVVAVGACGRCTAGVMRAVAAAQGVNIPAVAVVSTGFEKMARSIATILGDDDPRLAVYPGAIQTDTQETFEEKVDSIVVGEIERLLTADLGADGSANATVDHDPRAIVFSGTLDEVEAHFLEQGWSEGLPIVPPTLERVDRFLEHTTEDPSTVIGVIAPENREITVWNIAVNAVMAGCRPEYMPVLIAIAQCVVDPKFRSMDFTSTFGMEPLVVVSGPIVEQLNFNYGTGAMRLGRQANTSIGRFLRLLLRNVGGLRIPTPESDTDAGAIGFSFNVVMAENEEATRAMGWQPFRVDNGFSEDQSTVSLLMITNISQPIYTAGDTPERHLETLAQVLGNSVGPWAYTSTVHHGFNPLLYLSPNVARALAEFGYDKQRIRDYLGEHLWIKAGVTENYARMVGRTDFTFDKFVEDPKYRPIYVASTDPDRLVPVLMDSDWVSIVVGGNPGRNQSKAYIGNLTAGPPVTHAIGEPIKRA